MKRRIAIACGFILAVLMVRARADSATADGLWVTQVEPVLDRYCFKCHGGVRQKSGLDLRSLERILEGGERGPAIVPGQPEESHLYQFVQPAADPHMPTEEKKQLTAEDLTILRTWIARLPRTNKLLSATSEAKTSWPREYVRALQACQKPLWTPPANLPPHRVIDGYIARAWSERRIKASGICDDHTFARRVYLDLAGRIPRLAELEVFLKDGRRDKRAHLVDALLAGDDYPRHMREVFDVVLMGRRGEGLEKQREEHHWFEFLERAFRENRAWNEIMRELIVARPSPDDRGAIWFLYERKNNYQELAEALAPIAFGVQIGCAQCHNHPLAWEIEQRHYWGLVAAFNRSKNVDCANGPGVAESAIGGFVNFANLKKESQPALLAFLNGRSVSEKRPAEGEKEEDAPDLYRVPPPPEKTKPLAPSVPRFSRREALADAITTDNPQLARAFVNRLWAMLLGRGLVHPVDQMDSRHRPSHPELLNWLARDFDRSGYDVKRLIREIALSRTYQLNTRPASARAIRSGGRPRNSSLEGAVAAPLSQSFAHALEKPLSGEQLYRSFMIATGNEPSDGKVAGHDETEVRHAFVARFPDLFQAEYNPSLQQAMFLSNSPFLDDLVESRPGNETARLLALAGVEDRVEQAFLSVLGRKPERDEGEHCRAFLARRNPEAGVKQLLWALLTCAEFQVNH